MEKCARKTIFIINMQIMMVQDFLYIENVPKIEQYSEWLHGGVWGYVYLNNHV